MGFNLFDSFSSSPGRRAANQSYAANMGGLNLAGGQTNKGYGSAIGATKAGYRAAIPAFDYGTQQAAGQYTSALAPFGKILGQEQQGRNAYMDSLGLRGPAGNARAMDMFQVGPGYQFQMDQGNEALNRTAASRGMLTSGNNTEDILRFSHGLADQEYGGWQDRLAGFNPLAAANSRAAIMQNLASMYSGAGTAKANLLVGQGQDLSGLHTGRAGTLANLAIQRGQQGGQLAENRFAAENAANQNIWGAIGGVAGLAAGGMGMGAPWAASQNLPWLR